MFLDYSFEQLPVCSCVSLDAEAPFMPPNRNLAWYAIQGLHKPQASADSFPRLVEAKRDTILLASISREKRSCFCVSRLPREPLIQMTALKL